MKKIKSNQYGQVSLMVLFAMLMVLSVSELSKNDLIAGKHDIPETIFRVSQA